MNHNGYMLIADDEEHLVKIDQENAMMYVYWKRHIEGELFKDKFKGLLKIIGRFRPVRWLGNAQATHYTTVQDARWFLNHFLPQLVDSSISRYARVETRNSLMLLDSLNLQEKLANLSNGHPENFEFRYFTEEPQAFEWLRS